MINQFVHLLFLFQQHMNGISNLQHEIKQQLFKREHFATVKSEGKECSLSLQLSVELILVRYHYILPSLKSNSVKVRIDILFT